METETKQHIERIGIGETSPNIVKIAEALVEAQKEMSAAKKDAKNPFFNKSYADLNSIREACMPALNAAGITVLQPIVYMDGKSFVKTILLHKTGEYISCLTEVVCSKQNDAQSLGSGQTYARRYGLQALCCVGSEDDDGNAASDKKTETKKAEVKPDAKSEAYEKYHKTLMEADVFDANEKLGWSMSQAKVPYSRWNDAELEMAYQKLITKIAYKKSLVKK